MAKEVPTLGELEIQILRLVWENQPCTDRQVWEIMRQDREMARTTVLKAMQRLTAKGVLTRVKGSKPVQFRAAIEETHVLPKLVGRFVNAILGGSAEPLVAFLANSGGLSAKDIEALRAVARKIDKGDKS